MMYNLKKVKCFRLSYNKFIDCYPVDYVIRQGQYCTTSFEEALELLEALQKHDWNVMVEEVYDFLLVNYKGESKKDEDLLKKISSSRGRL